MSLKFITMPDGKRWRCKDILRLRKQLIPAALGLQLVEDESSDGLLVGFREFCCLGDCLLQKSTHDRILH